MGARHAQDYPVPSVRRLPQYLRLLREWNAQGREAVSCTQIAEALALGTVQVRKDLAMTDVVGRPKIGYPVPALVEAIESFLGWNHATAAVVVGAGGLGSAILGYEDFKRHGLNIVVAFDVDPIKIGHRIHGKDVLPVEALAEQVARIGALIGIITVPAAAAQEVADELVRAGVRAIWNFSPTNLEVPDSVVVQNVRFVDSLAVLSQRLHQVLTPD
jgi:redox-sensing transcriptional repressor